MATRIIRKAPKFKEIEVTCVHCQCVFASDDPNDFRRSQGGDFREYWDQAQIECPECGKNVAVSSERFPSHIYASLAKA